MKALAAALLAAAVLAASGCAGARRGGGEREVTVEAEGYGVLEGQRTLPARQRALAEAQKKAVEKAVGVTVRARTRVEAALNVQQSIEANLGGIIRRFKVLSEGPEGDYYKVAIQAVVLYRPQDVAKKQRPSRVLVRLPDEKVASALRNTLLLNEFPLADGDQDADLMIGGIVETYGRSDPRLNGFYSHKVVVSLSVADRKTGTAHERKCEASALDLDDALARSVALETAGRNCALSLVSGLGPPGESVAAAPELDEGLGASAGLGR